MLYNNLSVSLRNKISQYNLATSLYKDVASAWGILTTKPVQDDAIDSEAIKDLAEKAITDRLICFYKQRAELSESILLLATKETAITYEYSNQLTNKEKIDCVDRFILDILTDAWGWRPSCYDN